MDSKAFFLILWRRKWVVIFTMLIALGVAIVGAQQIPVEYTAEARIRVLTSSSGSADFLQYDLRYTDRLMNTYSRLLVGDEMLGLLRTELGISELPEISVTALPETEFMDIVVKDTDPELARDTANTLADIVIARGKELLAQGDEATLEVLRGEIDQRELQLNKLRDEYNDLLNNPESNAERIALTANLLTVREEDLTSLQRIYSQAQSIEAERQPRISLVHEAELPASPSSPNLLMIIALGGILGAAGGVGLAFVIDSMDHTLRTRDEIQVVSGLPILGAIPASRWLRKRRTASGKPYLEEAFRRLRFSLFAPPSTATNIPAENRLPIAEDDLVKNRLLIIEDDVDTQQMLTTYFETQGYEVFYAHAGADGIALTRAKLPNLVLLDVMLPDMDGFDVCRELRSATVTRSIPITFLTARGSRADKLAGLELGADDYVTKPFDVEELRLRVQRSIVRASRDHLYEPRTGLPSGPVIEGVSATYPGHVPSWPAEGAMSHDTLASLTLRDLARMIEHDKGNGTLETTGHQHQQDLSTAPIGSRPSYRGKVALFTSSVPDEGKTTVVSNLARVIGLSNRPVLVIDGNLLSPGIHKQMRLPNTVGLTDVLYGHATLEDAIQSTATDNVDALTVGSEAIDASAYLESATMRQVIEHAVRNYEHVLIDGSALLASVDSLSLASLVDTVVLVVRQDHTKASALSSSRNLLTTVAAPILGVIVNCASTDITNRYHQASEQTNMRTNSEAGAEAWRRSVSEYGWNQTRHDESSLL
jgi:capsular exopolysaccharide synthesis family protein